MCVFIHNSAMVYDDRHTYVHISFRCIKENIVLIKKAFTDDFVIPEFPKFLEQVQDIYELCKDNDGGAVCIEMNNLSIA